MDEDGCTGCLLIVVIAVAVVILMITDKDESPTMPDVSDVPEQVIVDSLQEEDPNLIEGVVVRLIPGRKDITTVVFENGDEYDLNLGNCQIYVGEWNQLRVDNGVVHESYLGEGTVQEMARD